MIKIQKRKWITAINTIKGKRENSKQVTTVKQENYMDSLASIHRHEREERD